MKTLHVPSLTIWQDRINDMIITCCLNHQYIWLRQHRPIVLFFQSMRTIKHKNRGFRGRGNNEKRRQGRRCSAVPWQNDDVKSRKDPPHDQESSDHTSSFETVSSPLFCLYAYLPTHLALLRFFINFMVVKLNSRKQKTPCHWQNPRYVLSWPLHVHRKRNRVNFSHQTLQAVRWRLAWRQRTKQLTDIHIFCVGRGWGGSPVCFHFLPCLDPFGNFTRGQMAPILWGKLQSVFSLLYFWGQQRVDKKFCASDMRAS